MLQIFCLLENLYVLLVLDRSTFMFLFLEIGQYFGTSQNGIEDKKNGTEGVFMSWVQLFKLIY